MLSNHFFETLWFGKTFWSFFLFLIRIKIQTYLGDARTENQYNKNLYTLKYVGGVCMSIFISDICW